MSIPKTVLPPDSARAGGSWPDQLPEIATAELCGLERTRRVECLDSRVHGQDWLERTRRVECLDSRVHGQDWQANIAPGVLSTGTWYASSWHAVELTDHCICQRRPGLEHCIGGALHAAVHDDEGQGRLDARLAADLGKDLLEGQVEPQ